MRVGNWKKTYWQDENGSRVTIEEVLNKLQGDPVIEIKLSDLAHIPATHIEEHRKLAADLSYPIIVWAKRGEYCCILDGHHRRQKAIDEKMTYILGKVFMEELFDESR